MNIYCTLQDINCNHDGPVCRCGASLVVTSAGAPAVGTLPHNPPSQHAIDTNRRVPLCRSKWLFSELANQRVLVTICPSRAHSLQSPSNGHRFRLPAGGTNFTQVQRQAYSRILPRSLLPVGPSTQSAHASQSVPGRAVETNPSTRKAP